MKGEVAGKSPLLLDLESGKAYAWCSCGKSENQPWCNGAHKVTNMVPKVFQAEENKKAAICLCKQTNNPPYCDGSHNKLSYK